MEIIKPVDVMNTASPEARKIIEKILKIEQEGRHYKNLPSDMERDFCDRIIKAIKDEVKS